nr:unnamed protein product [Spirometra erinaceieuropaei]
MPGFFKEHQKDMPLRFDTNELAQRLAYLLVTAAAAAAAAVVADLNVSVENRWCQLRNTVQSTTLAVLGCARRQHQDWSDDIDTAISNLSAEKNRLHKAYGNRPTNDNKAVVYLSRRLVPCNSSPAGKHMDGTRSLLRSTSRVAPNSWII